MPSKPLPPSLTTTTADDPLPQPEPTETMVVRARVISYGFAVDVAYQGLRPARVLLKVTDPDGKVLDPPQGMVEIRPLRWLGIVPTMGQGVWSYAVTTIGGHGRTVEGQIRL